MPKPSSPGSRTVYAPGHRPHRRIPQPAVEAGPADPELVRPARREELVPVLMLAVVAGMLALAVCSRLGLTLLYGDAVAHLAAARRLTDVRYPGLAQLGRVWLPLPHLLMAPFAQKMQWWQNGLAGAWPSLVCYVVGVLGFYRLARRVLAPRWAAAATAFYGFNANLLYLATTAMTEPLFLAILIWTILLLLECVEAIRAARPHAAGWRMVALGLLIVAGVLTRYDGWVLGAAVWCVVAWHLWRCPGLRRSLAMPFAAMTLLALAGPAFWFWYNHWVAGDWLDFMRGPYSAKEIDRRTSTPGARKYFGWHDPAWSLMLYARTAQVVAAWWETGWLVAAASLWGGWLIARKSVHRAALLLLWMPLPFYVYSISWGSVPIFIPQIYPHSFYNSRYGMEMLPCFALFGGIALQWAVRRWLQPRHAVWGRLAAGAATLLAALNLPLMVHATPLVLREAQVNSAGRLAIEKQLALELESFPSGSQVMMSTRYVGALQIAGIPMRQLIEPDDYYQGKQLPAEKAAFVVASDGDEVAAAVHAHPEELKELAIICSTKEPCTRVYRSSAFQPPAS